MRVGRQAAPGGVVTVCTLGMLWVAAPAAHAGQGSPSTVNPARPFERGTVGIELGVGPFVETWDLNANGRERLVDGTVSLWWAFTRRATLVVEFHATRVFQDTVRHAFVTGLVPVVRVRALDRGAWQLFGEIGVGPSWSDATVPAGGTRFNYVGLAGLGASHPVARRVDMTAGFRWLHLSNNGREGHDHNPDIQALGGYAAVTVAF